VRVCVCVFFCLCVCVCVGGCMCVGEREWRETVSMCASENQESVCVCVLAVCAWLAIALANLYPSRR